MRHLPRILFIAVLLFTTFAETKAQQPSAMQTDPCAQFYNQDGYERAIEILQKIIKEKPDDYVTVRCLGLFYYKAEMYLMAIFAFDKLPDEQLKSPEITAKYAYASLFTDEPINAARYANMAISSGFLKTAEMYYVLCESNFRQSKYEEALSNCDEAIRLDSKYEFAYLTKSMILLNLKREGESADYLEKFLKLRPNDEDAEIWHGQILTLRDGLKPITVSAKTEQKNDSNLQDVFTPKEVIQRASITAKPQPEYTEKARYAGHQGVVRLKAVLSSDGSVKHIVVLKPLRFGLITRAVRALKRSQFTPAQKDGKSVSQWITLEYNFRIY